MERSIWIGSDPREADAFAILRHSIRQHMLSPIPIRGLVLSHLRQKGLYYRPTTRNPDGNLWDVISDAPMATEFSISRFLVPLLVRQSLKTTLVKPHARWAVFMDCDMLVTQPIDRLFDLANPRYAVQVVKHNHVPADQMKMDGQIQTSYHRKNWSSVMLFNIDHPAHTALTVDVVNSVPGRDLHRFFWLRDDEIGELPLKWNYLVGHNSKADLADEKKPPANIHFTEGIPRMEGYDNCEFADLWVSTRDKWLRGPA